MCRGSSLRMKWIRRFTTIQQSCQRSALLDLPFSRPGNSLTNSGKTVLQRSIHPQTVDVFSFKSGNRPSEKLLILCCGSYYFYLTRFFTQILWQASADPTSNRRTGRILQGPRRVSLHCAARSARSSGPRSTCRAICIRTAQLLPSLGPVGSLPSYETNRGLAI
jgi:hypothetical protein